MGRPNKSIMGYLKKPFQTLSKLFPSKDKPTKEDEDQEVDEVKPWIAKIKSELKALEDTYPKEEIDAKFTYSDTSSSGFVTANEYDSEEEFDDEDEEGDLSVSIEDVVGKYLAGRVRDTMEEKEAAVLRYLDSRLADEDNAASLDGGKASHFEKEYWANNVFSPGEIKDMHMVSKFRFIFLDLLGAEQKDNTIED